MDRRFPSALALVACGGEEALLELGVVEELGGTPCDETAPDGAECRRISVDCPHVEPLAATVAVRAPDAPRGTVVLHGGAGGRTLLDQGFVDGLLAEDLRVVQIAWDLDWEAARGRSIRSAACRPATAFRWIRDTLHREEERGGFCALGHSGGSGAVSFALAWYGADRFMDHALLSAGPVFSRIDAGCDPVSAGVPGTKRDAGCAEIPSASFTYGSATAPAMRQWTGVKACGAPHGDLRNVDRLLDQSIVAEGADLAFPDTRLDLWWCAADTGGAVGQGSFFADVVTSDLERHCATGCTGERSWTNPDELPLMVATIGERCAPR